MPYDQFAYDILTASGSNLENPPAAYYKVLRDARRRDGEHDAALPGRALQLQQVPRPPVRALDAGPVLPAGRVTSPRSSRTEDPKFKGQKLGGTDVEGAEAAGRGSSPTRKAGEVKHERTGAGDAAAVPLHATPTMPAAGQPRREQVAQWITVEGQPVLRQELRQPPVELSARRRHHRAGGRHPRRQPADQPEAARPADRGIHRQRLRHAAAASRPSASRATYQLSIDDQPLEQGRRHQLLARHAAAAAGRSAVRRHPPRDRLARAACPACRRAPGPPQLLDSNVPIARRLPGPVRQAARARAPASASAPAA